MNRKFTNLVAGCSIHYRPVQQGGCCFLVPNRWKSMEQVSALLCKLQLVDIGSCISVRTIRLSGIFLWLMGCCNCLRFAPICSLLLPYRFHWILGFQNQSCAVHTYRSSMMRYCRRTYLSPSLAAFSMISAFKSSTPGL